MKLGAGGIREIEFVVQALHYARGASSAAGGRHAQGDSRPAELEFCSTKTRANSETAYRFPAGEHRLQIEAEQQTHTVLEIKAQPWPGALISRAGPICFEPARAHAPSAIFRRVVRDASPVKDLSAAEFAEFRDEGWRQKLPAWPGAMGFHVAPRTRQIFANAAAADLAGRAADPDATLTQFVRFVEAYGFRSLLSSCLTANPSSA